MESRSRRNQRMTPPADLPPAQLASGPAEPADLTKPAEDPVPPLDAPAAVVDPAPEASDAAVVAAPELEVPQILPPAPLAPPPVPVIAVEPAAERDLFAIIAESRAALARGVESVSDELASFARHNIDVTADTAIQMLAVRTWSDAVAVNAKFARTSYDQWLESTAKVSELGVRLAYESSKPFMSRLGRMLRGVEDGR
jgi:hypothetical protein